MIATPGRERPSVVDCAVLVQSVAILHRATHAGEIVRHGRGLFRIQAVEESREVGFHVEAMPCSDAPYLAHQVRVVLIAHRRNEAIIVASPVLLMARGALLLEDRFTELQSATVAGLRKTWPRQRVQKARQVGPRL